MNFTLTPPYRFEHLKIWFRENWHGLPKTLRTEIADHRDVRKAVDAAICSIDAHFQRYDKPNEVVNSYKRILSTVYNALQDESNWNLPLEKVEEKNRI